MGVLDASASAYRTMKSYSPYDNVLATNADGSTRVYPHLFATGGLNDLVSDSGSRPSGC